MQPTAQALGELASKTQAAPEGRKKRNSGVSPDAQGYAERRPNQNGKLAICANFLLRKTTSSVINNSPRAFVWLAGRFSATLVRVRHLMSLEGVNPSIAPATGLDSETPVGF